MHIEKTFEVWKLHGWYPALATGSDAEERWCLENFGGSYKNYSGGRCFRLFSSEEKRTQFIMTWGIPDDQDHG
jgi:hypothetical protein